MNILNLFRPKDEKVMAVPRKELFGVNDEGSFQGFLHIKDPRANDYDSIILETHKFLWRKYPRKEQQIPVEEDKAYKQIIPYCIIKHVNENHKASYFLYKHDEKNIEKKPNNNQFTLGIGGHINPIPMNKMNKLIEHMPHNFKDVLYENTIIQHSMKSKLTREIKIEDYSAKVLGYVNNDDTEIGRHHLGIVYLIELKTPTIDIKEKSKLTGKIMSKEELEKESDKFEGWTKILYNRIKFNLI